MPAAVIAATAAWAGIYWAVMGVPSACVSAAATSVMDRLAGPVRL